MKQALAGTVEKSLAHAIKNNLSINALPFFDSAGTSRLSYCGKSMPGSRLILYSHSSCHTRYIFLTVFVMLFALSGQAQQLEIFSGSGPAGNGPSANSGASTFYRNTATSATFTAHTPTLTYALSFTNQQYTTATTPGLTVGAQNTGSTLTALAADALLQLMNSNGGGVNSEYTSNPFGSPGTDFSTSSNYGFKLSTDATYQQEAGAALNARNYYGDMTITFSRPVLNPVIHLAGIGGGGRTVNYGMGYYTEFEMSTADVNAGYTLTRLSGTTYLNVTSTGILNSSTTPASVPPSTSRYTSQAAGNNGSGGSIRVNTNGTFISSLTFRVYLRGDGSVGTGAAWNTGNRSGDGFMLSVSLGLYNVNGTVYNDANGLTDNTVNGTGSNGGGLFANLVDASGIVVSSVAVAANGTYTLSNTPAGNYTIILTTTTAAVGSSLSVATLPVGYGSTGEFVGATAGNDGTVDSKLAVTVTNGDIANANLGMQTGWYDFGDAPASFDLNSASSSVPARNGPSSTLLMGTLPDLETAPAAVANGSDNNGSNGDGADEDGQTTPAVITIGSAYSRTISYTNTSGTSRTVYGWIDFNNNGIFEAAEVASTLGTATTGVTNGTTSLTWSATQTRDALAGNLYMRIRVSASTTMADNGATAVDERAIADGANGGTYGTAFIGEVEDYRVTVTALYDMGDVPASYERNASSVSLPARNIPSATLRIGTIDDAEFTPASVASGSDNNGSNGDGTEEDGATSPPPAITAGLAYTLPVTVTNTSGTNRVLHGWVDFNNNGIFEATEYTSVTINTGTNGGSVNLAWTSTQTRDLTGVSLYMRLRLAAATLADNGGTAAVDERSIADGANTGLYGTQAIGEVEDYRVTVNPGYDMGDAPASYELNSSSTSLPARNIPSATLRIGTIDDVEFTPASVASGSDNNGSNGDGTEEDGTTSPPPAITAGLAYTLPVTVTNTSGTNRVLHGWVDFNNNGIFEATEYTSVTVNTGTNGGSVNLVWTSTQTRDLTGVSLYMRLRLAAASLADNSVAGSVDERAIADGASTGIYSTTAIGEVEDYRVTVNPGYDMGDAPASYELNSSSTSLPARNIPSATLRIGTIDDVEFTPASVASGSDNNGSNGDGTEEDGTTSPPPAITAGLAYTLPVTVTNTSGTNRVLHGWVDFNNNGIFEATEYTSVTVNTGTNGGSVNLVWTSTQTRDLTGVNLYMRLRLAAATLADNGGTAAVDERSIADGASTGLYGTQAAGELEDYRVTVNPGYDMGDAPASYELNSSSTSLPARNIPSATLLIGSVGDAEFTPASVTSPADNNSSNGDGIEEDGLTSPPSAVPDGGIYTQSVIVTNTTGTQYTLHGWIDFNNNGRFEVGEYQSVNVPTGTSGTGVILSWTAAQTSSSTAGNKIYMRLRLATATLADNGSTATVDERSIADGANTGVYGTQTAGEVEDYQVSVVTTDLGVQKMGPVTVNSGGAVSYTIRVSNYGPVAVTNVTVSDPAVANISISSITCTTAGTGSSGSATCPATVTVALLQAGNLTIPSLPNGSDVTFTVTGTATGAIGSAINNTVTVSLPAGLVDANPSNNSSTLTTTILDAACAGSQTTYTLNNGNTVSANTISANGGTINLVYNLSSGSAVPGIGNSFTISYVYSDLNAYNGTDHQWMGLGAGGAFLNSFSIFPATSNASGVLITGSIYNGRPTNNQQQEVSSGGGPDAQVSANLQSGAIDQVGTFDVTIGNYPSAAGYRVVSKTLQIGTVNNTSTSGNGSNQGGFLLKFIDQPINNGATNTVIMDVEYGRTYKGKYTAFSDGTIYPQSGTVVRGVAIRGSVTYQNNLGCSDLQVVKTGSATVVAGQPQSYTIVITNNGNGPADGATVSDPAVSNFTAGSVSCTGTTGGAACPVSPTIAALQAGTLAIPTLPSGATVTLTVSGTAGAGGTIANTATITTPVGINDAVSGNNSSTTNTTIYNTVSGFVYNDANGLSDNTVNGSGTNAGGTLQIVVYDSTLMQVEQVINVAADGSYIFVAGTPGNKYTLFLTTTAPVIGQSALPVVTLPAGYVNTGEYDATGAGSDGMANSVLPLGNVSANVSSAVFGIEEPPTAGSGTQTTVNPGGTAQVTVNASAFTNTTASSDPSPGAVTAIRITSFPANVTSMVINGTSYTSATFPVNGVTIPADASGNPAQTISVDPTATGTSSISISFKAVDEAGQESSSTGTATLNLDGLVISGTVRHDFDGGSIDGAGIGTPSNEQLYANLVDPVTGNVVGSVAVAANGSYSLGSANGVEGNTSYNLVISTVQGVPGTTTGATASLPAGWAYTADGTDATTGDGSANGLIAVNLGSTSIINTAFGLNIKPQATMFNYFINPVPTRGGTYALDGTYRNMQSLYAEDTEDGALGITSTFVVIGLGIMDGNILSYNGVQITGPVTIANYNPALLTITFNQSGNSGFSFNYAVRDAAGVQSDPASYTVSWGLGVLAVKLVSFDASRQNGKALLQWVTAEETGKEHFEVQRSIDSRNWQAITRLPAKAGTGNNSYNFTDNQPQPGTNYYRLLLNNEGIIAYSPVRKLDFAGSWKVSLSPNPVHSNEAVTLQSSASVSSIKLLDAQGRVLRLINGSNIAEATYRLNTQGLAKGLYFVKVINAQGKIQTLKLVKSE